MKTYLVIEAETTKLHGIFWARTLEELWDVVDEMADPSHFEYCELKKSGGVWHDLLLDEVAEIVQDDDEEAPDGEDDILFPPLTTSSETFLDILHNQARHKWMRFDCIDEGVGFLARLRQGGGAA